MLELLLSLLAAFAKTFAIAGALNLPLDNIRKIVYSSESVLSLFLFLFVVGETKSVFPAMLVTAFYLYVEVVPRKLKLNNEYFEDYHRA